MPPTLKQAKVIASIVIATMKLHGYTSHSIKRTMFRNYPSAFVVKSKFLQTRSNDFAVDDMARLCLREMKAQYFLTRAYLK